MSYSPEERKERTRAAQEKWRAANKAKIALGKKTWKNNNREEWRRRRREDKIKQFMSLDDYHTLLNMQDHRCAICKSTDPNNKNSTRFCIDHCHRTGRIRGLLCHRCNTMLGAAIDSQATILKAIAYLERFQ